MALVEKLERTEVNARPHKAVRADYNVVIHDGQKYVQINTYGAADRKTEGASQIIQLNAESAKQLIDILKSEFGI